MYVLENRNRLDRAHIYRVETRYIVETQTPDKKNQKPGRDRDPKF